MFAFVHFLTSDVIFFSGGGGEGGVVCFYIVRLVMFPTVFYSLGTGCMSIAIRGTLSILAGLAAPCCSKMLVVYNLQCILFFYYYSFFFSVFFSLFFFF